MKKKAKTKQKQGNGKLISAHHICIVRLYLEANYVVSMLAEKLLFLRYIPLISRVRPPYVKLWSVVFPSFYGHENKEGENEDP